MNQEVASAQTELLPFDLAKIDSSGNVGVKWHYYSGGICPGPHGSFILIKRGSSLPI